MELLDKGRDALRDVVDAGKRRIARLNDDRRYRALIVDLGELTYAQQTTVTNGETEAEIARIVEELRVLDESRGGLERDAEVPTDTIDGADAPPADTAPVMPSPATAEPVGAGNGAH